MTERVRLTDALALTAQPREREYAIHDTALQGFMLRVQPNGARSWVFRFRRDRKPRRITLGKPGAVKADQARAAALAFLAREKGSGRPSASACFIIDDSTASARFAEAARVRARSSNQLRTSFVPIASTRRSPNAGIMWRFMPSACARRVAGFQRSAQSARNAGANVRTVGTAAGARFASASASSARAACRASSTVSASSAPSVRLTTEPLQRRCTIHVLRPFGRARSPSPGAALSHSTASRSSAEAKTRAPAIVIFVLFVIFRSFSFMSVATGASWAFPLGNTQDTPGNGVGFGVRKVGGAALNRRAGCKPLPRLGLQRFADARWKCDSLRPSAFGFHT